MTEQVWGPVVTVPEQPKVEQPKVEPTKVELAIPRMSRESILETARVIVSADRNTEYGEPEQNFSTIAELWTMYMGVPFEAHEVAVLQLLVKVARLRQSPEKMDHWVDIAGYAACGGEVAQA